MRTHLLRAAGIAAAASALALPVLAEAGQAAASIPARPVLAFVANHDGTVTAINTATDVAAKPVKVAFGLSSVAVSPDGRTAYVGNPWASQMAASSYVFPVNAATDKPGKAIDVQTVPTGHRDYPEREDRLRLQRRDPHGDRVQHRHQHRPQADQGPRHPNGHRDP